MTEPGNITDKGLARPGRAVVWRAIVATLAWLGVVGWWFLAGPGHAAWADGPPDAAAVPAIVAALVPVALIWTLAAMARSTAQLRHELETLRQVVTTRPDDARAPEPAPTAGQIEGLQAQMARLAEAQRKLDRAVARLEGPPPAPPRTATARPKPLALAAAAPGTPPALPAQDGALPPAASPAQEQPRLALAVPAASEHTAVGAEDFLVALNFPVTMDDRDGFRALRLALEDRRFAPLLRAAQDVLTLLSEDGIYMDDLTPDRARPEVWRRFAAGVRSGAVADLGGVRDPAIIDRTVARLRSDPVFRDAVHHFLRRFDRMLEAYAPAASDADLVRLAESRTARAFMLLGRATGIFG